MPTNNSLFDDILTLGSSLLGNLLDARHELKAQAKSETATLLRKLDLVSRDEFDATFAMLAKARAMQEEMLERLATLEAQIGKGSRSTKSSAKNAKKPANKNLPSVKPSSAGKKKAR